MNDGPAFRVENLVVWSRDWMRARRRDRRQSDEFGPGAPLYSEAIRVEPGGMAGTLATPLSRRHSGRVVAGDWDLDVIPHEAAPKLAYCLARWRDGQSWEEAGAIDHHMKMIAEKGQIDGIRRREDVLRRLERLDQIFDRVRRSGELAPKSAIRRPNFRESGGIYVHLGRDGRGIFGQAGNHRFGMALAAGLASVPAQIGQVHPDALPRLAELRGKGGL